MGRAIRKAFAKGVSSEEINGFFGMTYRQLRRYLIAASHYGPDTVQMWHDGLLHVDHIIPMALLRKRLGAFVTTDNKPTLYARMANCVTNLNLLRDTLNLRKGDDVYQATWDGMERRYDVLMCAVALTAPGTGIKICPHPTKEMDDVKVDFDILCELMEKDVAANGGEIGCENL